MKSSYFKLFKTRNVISNNASLIIEGSPFTSSEPGSLEESCRTELRKYLAKLLRFEDNYQRLKADIQKMDQSMLKHLWAEITHLETEEHQRSSTSNRLFPDQIKRFMELQGHKLDNFSFWCLKKKLELSSFTEAEFAALLSGLDRDSLTTKPF